MCATRASAAHAFFRRSAPSLSAAAFAALYGVVLVVLGVLREHGRLPLTDVAATPAEIGAGKVWLLVTSGVIVEGNLPLSVVGVATLVLAVLFVCDWRVLWAAGALGHVGSALGTYAALAVVARLQPHRVDDLRHALDYGISAFVAAGLGALAVGAWQRRTEWPLTMLWPATVLASVASLVLMTVHVLDPFWFEHIPAFGIGAATAFALRTRAYPNVR